MNYLGLIFGLAIVGVVVYLMAQNRKRSSGAKRLDIKEFTTLCFNLNDIDAIKAEKLGNRLRSVAQRAWIGLQAAYGDEAEMYIKHIVLDPDFIEEVKVGNVVITRKACRLTMPGNTMILRPQGSGGHPPEFWFALELHNLYRGTVFGIDKIYLTDSSASDEEVRLWNAGQKACKDAAP